jgi:hypothetical protein
MRFKCSDLKQSLKLAELPLEAQEHLKSCGPCRREYQVWIHLSVAAKELRRDWQSPALWINIKARIAVESESAVRWWTDWRVLGMAASIALIGALLLVRSYVVEPAHPSRDFLTEQALQDVEKNENAYVKSIQTLSRLAESKLAHPATPLNEAYGEKLAVLDAAIAETRVNLAQNQFNIRLRTELAGLYTEKQETLRELLTGEKSN